MARRQTTKIARAHGRHTLRIVNWFIAVAVCLGSLSPVAARAGALDEMSLDRWAKLREAERYQLNIAEKYYREKNWKVALSEYEKFVTLYEQSAGASYAQFKWSHCLVQQRKLNTAIKDGYQSVIDYWPDSPEAMLSQFCIGRTYKDMGEIRPAKKAYADVLSKSSKHLAGVLARVDLLDIARIENDAPRRVALWKELTFDIDRTGEAGRYCQNASRELATYQFYSAAFSEGLKALETTYSKEQLPQQVVQYSYRAVSDLTAQADSKAKGEKLADQIIAWLREQTPEDLTEDAQKAAARQVWFYMADIQTYSRRPEKVPQMYDQLIKLVGIDDSILGRLAGWYKSQTRRDEARSTYLRFEDKIQGQSYIATMFREEKKYPQAVAIYQRLAGEDADRAAQWQSNVATTYREAGKPDEAVAVYQQLITDDSEHASNWQWQIAITYRDFRRDKEAIASFRLCDNYPESYKQMAWCHRRLKQFNEAIVLYTQILGGHESSAPWALLQIGYTREQAGDKEKAISALQQVCRRFPKTGQASEAHAYLQNKYKITATLGGAAEK